MMKPDSKDLISALATLPAAFALWYLTFAVQSGNFWLKIALSSALLAAISLAVMGPVRRALLSVRARHLKLGLSSAVFLYLVFWGGRWALTALLPGAETDISNVYGHREELSPWLIGALLLLVTGPSEELYWRGLLQRVFAQWIGPASGLFLAASFYALAHIWTLNLPLLLAAFTAGLLWGWIYFMERSLVPVIVSHALWSVVIFVLLPLG